MKELINISGQQFYYSTIDQLIERSSLKKKCALIIDNSFFDEFVIKGIDTIGTCVNQIIIISGNTNTALIQLIGKDVLLMTADNFEEAVRFAIYGSTLSTEVICIPKEDETKTSQIIDVIVV